MPSNDQLFEQLLASAQEEYSKASSNWMPDPGTYNCVLMDIQTGTFQDKKDPKRTLFFVKPVWQITGHTTLDGQQFQGSMMTNRSQGALGVLKGFLEDLNGEAIENIIQAVNAARSRIGCLCEVAIVESKDGQYKNDRLKEVLGVAEPATA